MDRDGGGSRRSSVPHAETRLANAMSRPIRRDIARILLPSQRRGSMFLGRGGCADSFLTYTRNRATSRHPARAIRGASMRHHQEPMEPPNAGADVPNELQSGRQDSLDQLMP